MTVLGIDLGTSNSLVGYWNGEKVELIDNVFGKKLTPSVVGVDDNGDILIGEVAKQRLITHPECTVSTFKRYMGTDKKYAMEKYTFTPIELSAILLNTLKEDAEYTKKIDLALKYYFKCSYNYKRIGLQKLVKKYKFMSERNKYLYILELNKMFGKDASFAIQYRTEIIIFSIVCILIIIILSRSNLILHVP